MEARFRDGGHGIYSFMDETLVVCPKCSGCAITKQRDKSKPVWSSPRRLVCTVCSYTSDWARRQTARGWYKVRDDYFELPLWLQSRCCGEVLWAYNERQIEFIEGFVGARLRERVRSVQYGWSNASLASRLPAWMKSGKNRDEVLKAASRLRDRLPAR
jgi:hypothetical protein